jgi:CRISPR/Cas system CSM-associated protein Csm2 small subunit
VGDVSFLALTGAASAKSCQIASFFQRHLFRGDIATESGHREEIGLELTYARIWLAGISAGRSKPEIRHHFMEYLEQMADVLDKL